MILSFPAVKFSVEYTFHGLAQWCTPVIPTLWVAEMGGLLEHRHLRPSLAAKRDPISTKKEKQNKNKKNMKSLIQSISH